MMMTNEAPSPGVIHKSQAWDRNSQLRANSSGIRQRLAQDPEAPLEVQPELLMLRQSRGERGTFVCSFDETSAAESAIALLQEKRVPLPFFKGCPWGPKLEGVRLVGGRVLGVHSSSDMSPIVAELSTLIDGRHSSYDCLLVEMLGTHEPLWRAMTERHSDPTTSCMLLGNRQLHWELRFPDTADDYWQSNFTAKTRYNIRRACKRLHHVIETVEHPGQVDGFLSAAAEVSRRSWQGTRLGPRVRNDESSRIYHRKVAELGAARNYLLRHAGRPLAFAIGTQWRGRFMLEEIGFDQEFAKSSPGTVLMARMLEDMCERKTPDVVDFGFGDSGYKQMFGNKSYESGNLLIVSRRKIAALKVATHHAGQRAESWSRTCLRHLKLDERARRAYRGRS